MQAILYPDHKKQDISFCTYVCIHNERVEPTVRVKKNNIWIDKGGVNKRWEARTMCNYSNNSFGREKKKRNKTEKTIGDMERDVSRGGRAENPPGRKPHFSRKSTIR